MSELSDMRAMYELANARAVRAEAQLASEKVERNYYAAIAERVHQAEALAAAQEKLVQALSSTEDPLSPMAVLAAVSEERDAAMARVKELEAAADPKALEALTVADLYVR